jgi:glutamate/tyrosine decarboxylase-like PLP-dependent enzyme
MGVFADALAAAMNLSCAGGNHGAIYVEREVIQWLREMLGFPASAMGLLVSGGSMATLTALGVARQVKSGVDVRAAGLRGAPQPFRFYQSSQGHSCARKAVELLGFGSDAIRIVPTTADYRIDPPGLDRAIAEDVAAGVRPIAASRRPAPSTPARRSDRCRRRLCAPRCLAARRRRLRRTGDSTDDTAQRRRSRAPTAPPRSAQMDVRAGRSGFVDSRRRGDAVYGCFVPPHIRATGSSNAVMGRLVQRMILQTARLRALMASMTMKQFGLAMAVIEENIALARYLADRIRQSPDLEVVSAGLSIVCFRYKVASEVSDTLNRRLLEQVQLGGEAFLTSTEIDGRFVLRACIVNYHSTRADIDRMLDAIRQVGVELTHQAGLPQ